MTDWLDKRVYFLLGCIAGAALAWLFRPQLPDETDDLLEAIDVWIASKHLGKEG